VLATKKTAVAFISVLLLSAAAGLADLGTANPDTYPLPIITMPEEYINYTITRVNGTLWAKIDGTYPLCILNESDGAPSCVPQELPMVYPTPPGTTNIHVKVDETELDWSNWPQDTHHTAIGDWNMIYCVIAPVPKQFVLKIHYEHPLEQVNGSYLFLYDLNISPYLSPWSSNSTAYFTIRLDANVSNVRAYTTETDSVWKPMNYTTSQEGTIKVIAIQMYSENPPSNGLDLVVMFSDTEAGTAEVTSWIILPLVVIAALLAFIIYRKKHQQKTNPHLQH
jgi:hypothetical protein